MKISSHDWKVLQWPLAILGLVVIVLLVLVVYTIQQTDQARAAMEAQQSQLNTARQRFQTSGAESEAIVKYMPLYLELVRQGFIGEERRIEWIDDLRTINQQYKLFGINYSIGPQEAYKPTFNLVTGGFTLHESTMKIETALLHEGDLLTILNALSAEERAPFMVRDCVMSRLGQGSKNKFLPNLTANCEIEWLTVSEPPHTGGTKP